MSFPCVEFLVCALQATSVLFRQKMINGLYGMPWLKHAWWHNTLSYDVHRRLCQDILHPLHEESYPYPDTTDLDQPYDYEQYQSLLQSATSAINAGYVCLVLDMFGLLSGLLEEPFLDSIIYKVKLAPPKIISSEITVLDLH